MKNWATLILIFLFIIEGKTQVEFVATTGALTQSSLYPGKYRGTAEFSPTLFLGCGVNYRINKKLSIDQLLVYHFKDKQIPRINGLDQNLTSHFLNMHFSLNYKFKPKWELLFGFSLGSLFVTENFIGAVNTFIQSDGNDIVMLFGIRGKLSPNFDIYLKHDLLYLQKQTYFSWLTHSPSQDKIGVVSLGLAYTPFKN